MNKQMNFDTPKGKKATSVKYRTGLYGILALLVSLLSLEVQAQRPCGKLDLFGPTTVNSGSTHNYSYSTFLFGCERSISGEIDDLDIRAGIYNASGTKIRNLDFAVFEEIAVSWPDAGSYEIRAVLTGSCNNISCRTAAALLVTVRPRASACAGLQIRKSDNTLTSSITAGVTSYRWYRNDQLLAGEVGPSITVSRNGRYRLRIVKNGDTCENTYSFLTAGCPAPNISIVGGLAFIHSLIVRSDFEFDSYTWYLNGEEVGTGKTLEICEPGEYKVTARMEPGTQCQRSAWKTVSNMPPIRAKFTYTNCYRNGSPFEFKFKAYAGNLRYPTEYLWDFGDGTTSTSAEPNHVYEKKAEPWNDRYTVTLTVKLKDTGLCKDRSYTVRSRQRITIRKKIILADRALCAAQFPHELVAGGNFATYTWKKDGVTLVSDGKGQDRWRIEAPGDVGEYEVTAKKGKCMESETVKVRFIDDALSPKTKELRLSGFILNDVLSSSVQTYSDAWNSDFHALNDLDRRLTDRLLQKDTYATGQKGIWRAEGTYVYDTERSSAALEPDGDGRPDIRQDGLIKNLLMYNWRYEEVQLGSWLKSNTITRYNPLSYEQENRDVLGRHSAAIYGYKDQLTTAVGVNTRYEEMAFSGFEQNGDHGNFHLTSARPRQLSLDIDNGFDNIGFMEVPKADLQFLEGEKVILYGKRFSPIPAIFFGYDYPLYRKNRDFYFREVTVACVLNQRDNGKATTLIFDGRDALYDLGYWTGKLLYTKRSAAKDDIVVSTKEAHTGERSLEVRPTTTNRIFLQDYLKLEQGKTYILSAWVKSGNPRAALRLLMDGTTTDFKGSGEPIDGWTRIEGHFTYTSATNKPISLQFLAAGSTAYFDDLRLYPTDGNMQSYVYSHDNYRLKATLDNNNYATLYYYDAEGKLSLVKKETAEGIKTIQETRSYQIVD